MLRIHRVVFSAFFSVFSCIAGAAVQSQRTVALSVYDLSDNRWVYQEHVGQMMKPASVMKVFTSVAALDILGPRYRWTTTAYADHEPDRQGKIQKLWLVGSGDPMLLDNDFGDLLAEIHRKNVKIIDVLAIDLSAFSHSFRETLGDENTFAPYNIGPFPLIINYKTIEIDIDHHAHRVRLTAQNYLPEHVFIKNYVRLSNHIPCAQASIHAFYLSRGKNSFIAVRGTDSTQCTHHEIYLSILSHQAYVENMFQKRWREIAGTKIRTSTLEDAPAQKYFLARHESPPLETTLISMNKYSNNLMSYLTFLTIGYTSEEKKATFPVARRRVLNWLDQKGINRENIAIHDGCGISEENRLSAQFLSDLLRYAFHQSYFPQFLRSLPIAGQDGTLALRFKDSPLKQHGFMKTGRLKDVRSLAGYWQTPSGHWYSFVALMNCQNNCADDDLEWLDQRATTIYRQVLKDEQQSPRGKTNPQKI